MKHKSKSVPKGCEMRNLCFYGEHYFFETETEVKGAELATEAEFVEAVASVVHETEAGTREAQLTQNDRIEAGVEYLLATREA